MPYAPVIERANDEVQVGVDPDTALVFRGPGFGAMLDLLDGSQPVRSERVLPVGLVVRESCGALKRG